jgi:hypothetical protein
MNFDISSEERLLLLSLKNGISAVKIYKSGLYPTVVTFILKTGKSVTIRAKEECVAHWFEVFPITISEQVLTSAPTLELEEPDFFPEIGLNILIKSEWTISANKEEKKQMMGSTEDAMVQFEGLPSEIPVNAKNQVTLQSGIEIYRKSGAPFIVASSMFPFALYVSNCDFSESVNETIYLREPLC